jgi:hypothetical protein
LGTFRDVLSTGATLSLIIGFALLLGGFVVVAVPSRFQDDSEGRRSLAGAYGMQQAPARTRVASRFLAGAALVVGSVMVILSQVF